MAGRYTTRVGPSAACAIRRSPKCAPARRPARPRHPSDVAPATLKRAPRHSHIRATRRPAGAARRPDESTDPDGSRLGGARNNRCLAKANARAPSVRHLSVPDDSVAKILLSRDAGSSARVPETTRAENRTDGATAAGRGTSDHALRRDEGQASYLD